MVRYLVFSLFFVVGCGKSTPDETVNSNMEHKMLLVLGDSLTTVTQTTLLKTLTKKIKEDGPASAVTFCNIKAMPLTDSLARKFKVRLQRVSDKNRNPKNGADDADRGILEQWASGMKNGIQPKPTVEETERATVYYKPILLGMPTCLQCHGDPEKEITPEVREILRAKYPQDRAIGYKVGDLRGAWKVTLAKSRER
ncbi:MAG: DUF3365 domain-containing protein [Rhodothermia bacterium]|nr:DUF3365 domain-containing protein [Rhodothermia bacterium]